MTLINFRLIPANFFPVNLFHLIINYFEKNPITGITEPFKLFLTKQGAANECLKFIHGKKEFLS